MPDERSRRGRDQHLPAVAAGGDAGRPVDVHADVALLGQVRRAGMDARSAPGSGRPPARRVASAAAPSAPGAVGKATKKASPCVSTSTPPCAANASRRIAPVLGERLRVALRPELVQQPGRALDVGEEEGDGAGGKIAPHAARSCACRRADVEKAWRRRKWHTGAIRRL